MIEHVARGIRRGASVIVSEFDDESLILNATVDLAGTARLSYTVDVETQLVPLAIAKAKALDACERLRAAAEVFKPARPRRVSRAKERPKAKRS